MSAGGVTCVGYGDSADPRVWSGTPAALVAALRSLGYDVAMVNSLTPNRLLKLGQLACNVAAFRSMDFRRGPVARGHAAARARRGIDAAGNRNVLHFSVNHLPLVEMRPGERHYLYLDFTYDLRLGLAGGHLLSPFEARVDALDRAGYAQVDHFFSCSDYVRQNLITRYGIPAERISVVGTGLGLGFLKADVREKDYGNGAILFSSKLIDSWELKGGSLLLDGFALARREMPGLHLSIVGHDGYGKLVGDVPNVSTYGYVSWEKLMKLFAHASLFAMPALQEPWGLVYLEALACRTPILGLDRFSFSEISQYGKYGFACPEATPKAVAATILQAMASPDRLAEMGEGGQRYVCENFSWERTAALMADLMFAA